jgi:hypothetical protein
MSIALHRYRRSSAANRVHIDLDLKALDYRQVTYDPCSGAYREPVHPTLSAIAFPTLLAIKRCTQALAPRAVVKLEMHAGSEVMA